MRPVDADAIYNEALENHHGRRDGMSGLRFARGSAKGGKLMHDCCLICKHLEYRKNYVYPYRCLKHKAERFSEQELERMCFSGEKCGDFEERRFECLEEQSGKIVTRDED